jgi:hypothetical protein
MQLKLNIIILIHIVLIAAQGCASRATYRFANEAQRPSEHVRFFAELDSAVNRTGVRNGAYFQISGFPYLRANRFLVSLKERLENDAQQKQWAGLMQRLDIDARRAEIQNLPAAEVRQLADAFGFKPERKNLFAKAVTASGQLMLNDRQQPDFFEVLKVAVRDQSEYSTLMRVFGLYPLAAIPVAIVTLTVNDEFAEYHQLPENERSIMGTLKAYGPANAVTFNAPEAREILLRSRQNPLEIPLPSAADQKQLQAFFAPVIIQDVAAEYDKIGAVNWKGERPAVTPERPVIYTYFSHAYLKNEPILQINYVIWYPARSGPNSPRIERGNLDGLTIRVSLDGRGSPFMVDIMNNCGCYHFYIPRKEMVERILPSPLAIDAFVPVWLPGDYPLHRLAVRVMSGWHQVEQISSGEMPLDFESYQFVPYDQLEMLPKTNKDNESIFNSRGIAKHTERVESDIFIPMGVPQVGSMRQRGHHAIKFVGQAHFDDPHLFDDHFQFK